jgi:hypothetical protein
VIIEEEWADAQKIQLQRTPEYEVGVLVKYDSQYIYVAFTNLSEPEMARLNTDLLIQTIEAENEWDENSYWFHASYSNCFSRGEYYNWEFCAENTVTGFTLHTVIVFLGANTIIGSFAQKIRQVGKQIPFLLKMGTITLNLKLVFLNFN